MSFMIFPDNIWEIIISFDSISISDICRLSLTCKRLSLICQSSKSIWRRKFEQTWPLLYEKVLGENPDWFLLIKEKTITKQRVRVLLRELSKKYCSCKGIYLSHYAFDSFITFIGDNELRESFVIDDLRQILNGSNLTHKFYASQAVRFLVHRQLCQNWRTWLDGDIKLLEKGAYLFAQWFQPTIDINFETIDKFLNQVAESVRSHLKQTYPQCPLVTSKEKFDHETITESVWQSDICKQILSAVNFVFCGQYNFSGDSESYYDLENSLLDKVIERRKGLPITLSIQYHAIARRVGVYCYPVNFPSHFVLKFLEHPHLISDVLLTQLGVSPPAALPTNRGRMSDALKFTYIDVFNGCRFVSQYELWSNFNQNNGMPENPSYYDVPSSMAVLSRMITNVTHIEFKNTDVLCHGLELSVLLEPTHRSRHLLAQCYLQMEINFDKVIDLLNNADEANEPNEIYRRQYYIKMAETRLLMANQDEEIAPKLRSGENERVKFAVGMIMRHKAYDYTCVIVGWDPICAASSTWQQQMGVHRLERRHNQPFYHVLVNDGSNRYAAEENMLHETTPVEIQHGEVGKYFESFQGNRYKMNEEYFALYPEDMDFVTKCLAH